MPRCSSSCSPPFVACGDIPVIWLVDEDQAAPSLHLWSFKDYNDATNTGTDYGRVTYKPHYGRYHCICHQAHMATWKVWRLINQPDKPILLRQPKLQAVHQADRPCLPTT
ncbi:MAG: hypothetical protein IPO14_04520 [Saprospiraceae bacterium]|nr:hypothetical protein [Saprospiraceae bacterium]